MIWDTRFFDILTGKQELCVRYFFFLALASRFCSRTVVALVIVVHPRDFSATSVTALPCSLAEEQFDKWQLQFFPREKICLSWRVVCTSRYYNVYKKATGSECFVFFMLVFDLKGILQQMAHVKKKKKKKNPSFKTRKRERKTEIGGLSQQEKCHLRLGLNWFFSPLSPSLSCSRCANILGPTKAHIFFLVGRRDNRPLLLLAFFSHAKKETSSNAMMMMREIFCSAPDHQSIGNHANKSWTAIWEIVSLEMTWFFPSA